MIELPGNLPRRLLSAEGADWRQVAGTLISDILVALQHELWPRLKACRNPLCSVMSTTARRTRPGCGAQHLGLRQSHQPARLSSSPTRTGFVAAPLRVSSIVGGCRDPRRLPKGVTGNGPGSARRGFSEETQREVEVGLVATPARLSRAPGLVTQLLTGRW